MLVDKPVGPTSHWVVGRLRRITGIRKIGHAGTLDPFASGLLLLAIGREATREINQFVKLDKEYIADIFFGAETDTYDREGKITRNYDSIVSRSEIEEVLKNFLGCQKQLPPMFSAKKINGKKLYELARKNIEVERQPADIKIYELEILDYSWPILKLRVACSSGTYIRSLAFDIGRKLNCGAHLQELRRTRIGHFGLGGAVSIDELDENNWQEHLFYKKAM
ncbi:MAG: tRNA pseudouridine synthase B [Parcubacteria group bacterium GW2011_GWE2_39_37]|uniref:tRNA pseudouridine synthase B n=1 Tax=Candidatus Falkowbacteria bacterium GW2011_GWF2_39_8 TaxID=1618642 RepID=A0A0G0T5X5_9BACT|nr:MAG: tRNA pseudouridine synthase B [Parcubacteria group bacterium GW2011_GWE2_39_37]KKR33222.1 MAG: tRNA pseudouridine synthase B [Candidatus Falkowbacteria bacterium GW2011_GWF2_39_8]